MAGHALSMDLRHWLNDGLMTIFFFVVGLEIKREVSQGHLSSRRTAMLPVAAALGGMVVPALLYVAIAGRDAPDGWAVPMATDIALALGVIAVAGRSVPPGQRAFLLGLAIVDDIGAIAVIALFYSDEVRTGWLLGAVACTAAVVLARRIGVRWTWVYVVIGIAMWWALHEGGRTVHHRPGVRRRAPGERGEARCPRRVGDRRGPFGAAAARGPSGHVRLSTAAASRSTSSMSL